MFGVRWLLKRADLKTYRTKDGWMDTVNLQYQDKILFEANISTFSMENSFFLVEPHNNKKFRISVEYFHDLKMAGLSC